jgi:NAD+ diphosphatase
MIGCLATAAPNTEIRTDLDNELEAADFYSYEIVKAAVDKAGQTGMSRAEVAQIQKASDTAEESATAKLAKEDAASAAQNLRIPPKSAIAHTLIKAWVNQAEAESSANL